MPELIFDSQEAVPEAIRAIAAEKDGKWVANVVPKAELDDFRNRNIEISRDRDRLTSLTGRFQTDLGFDPEKADDFITEVTELRSVAQQVADGKLVKDSSLASAVESKTAEMRRGFESQVGGLTNENKALKGENEQLKGSLNRAVIDKEVMLAVTAPESGALPEATRQIMREAYDVFTVEDGKLTAKDRDGNIIYGADGATPMAPKEWLKKLQETTPFFFKGANGGGAGGGGGGGGALTQAQLDAMSPEEKMNYGRAHNMNR
jgi:regulator of replication initiation timing